MNWTSATPSEAAARLVSWLPVVLECPTDENGLKSALENAENHLLLSGEEAVGWMGLSQRDGEWLLDVAAKPDWHGKWATRSVLKEAGHRLFNGRDYILLENSQGPALRLALRLGANPVHLKNGRPTWLLSALAFNRRLH